MVDIKIESDEFIQALLAVDRLHSEEIINKVFLENSDFSLIEKIIIEALNKIGEGWEDGQYALAQIYMSGVICEELMDKYIPLVGFERKKYKKMAIGVLLDHHSLGKRIVSAIIKTNGYDLIDFGQGLSVDEIVELTVNNNIEILLISTLMLPSALKVKEVKEKLVNSGMNTKIVVGGAPFRFDEKLWEKVGADAMASIASGIINVLERGDL